MGARLRAARLRAGHGNASAFARLIEISPNTVYRIERGDIGVSVETLASWARACGTTMDALMRRSQARKGSESARTGTEG